MKQLVRLSCLLFSIVFSSAYVLCSTAEPIQCFSFSNLALKELFKQPYLEEGFGINTLVKTPWGYKPIQEIQKGDFVITYNNQEKVVDTTMKKFVKRYVRLVLNNITFHTGYDQLYCRLPDCGWIAAKDIKEGDILFNSNSSQLCSVKQVELIEEKVVIYSLTVEDHLFSIAPYDLCVHNAAALMQGASSIGLGYVVLVNPVVAMIGIGITLSTIFYNALQNYKKDDDSRFHLPGEVLLAERSYYEERKAMLEKLKHELLCIKNDLSILKGFCNFNKASFTYQFLKSDNIQNIQYQNKLLNISTVNEITLSEEQKVCLRQLREIELASLEEDIIGFHFILALHVNELIEQVKKAYDQYEQAKDQIIRAIDLWNSNLGKIDNFIALESYRADLLEEYLFNNFKEKVNELKSVALYYDNCVNKMCIRESTNIIELLKQMIPIVESYDQSNNRIAQNIVIVEQYFVSHGISTSIIKRDIVNALKKDHDDLEKKDFVDAQKKSLDLINSGGPKFPKKDDDEEDKNDCKVEIYEKNAQHIFRDEIGHLPDTLVNRKLLIDMVSDKSNFLGTCKYGNQWYSKTLQDGQQIWASVRNGLIRNGGLNNTLRGFNVETGLANMKR